MTVSLSALPDAKRAFGAAVHEAYDALMQEGWPPRPPWSPKPQGLPSGVHLERMFDVAFGASLSVEEQRRIHVAIAYCDPSLVAEAREDPLTGRQPRPIRLLSPIDLNVKNLVRIAPAVDPSASFVAVWAEAHANLAVWGIGDVALAGNAEASVIPASSMPDCLTLVVLGPGSISARYGQHELASVWRGTLEKGAAGSRLRLTGDLAGRIEAISLAVHDELAAAPLESWSLRSGDAVGTLNDPGRSFIFRLLTAVRALGHGGAVLLVPEKWAHNDAPLTDFLNVKYQTDDHETWPLVKAHSYWKGLRLQEGFQEPKLRSVNWTQFEVFRTREEQAVPRLDDRVTLLARLSSVDGAVLVTDRFRLLGFGVEVIAHADVAEVITDGGVREQVNSFGTRHRSAIRFCYAAPECAAFVVSQDGDVRGFMRVQSHVQRWDDLLARQ